MSSGTFNGATLTYDANGNLTGGGTNTYTWDARNHLSAIGGGTTASFVYDAFGRRMSRSINGTVTQFLYDGLNPVQELDGNVPPSPTGNLLTGLKIDEHFTRADSSGAKSSAIAVANSSSSIDRPRERRHRLVLLPGALPFFQPRSVAERASCRFLFRRSGIVRVHQKPGPGAPIAHGASHPAAGQCH